MRLRRLDVGRDTGREARDGMSDHDELTAARESFPCPVCTANAGEDCRERDGSPVDGLHPERTDRYRRELAAWRETQDGVSDGA